jgi:hypothetical protein
VLLFSPTAKQIRRLGHATPSKWLNDVPGWGEVMSPHADPFQCSTTLALVDGKPTAKQLPVPGHATAVRIVLVDPAGAGLPTVLHAVPFQRSVSPLLPAEPAQLPTAKQLFGAGHATPLRPAEFAPEGLGLA